MNNNDSWIKEYINEKNSLSTNSARPRKPKTDYGIGFVQMNKTRNHQTKRRNNNETFPKPRPITMNELLKNSLRFENVMRRVPKTIDRPV